MALNSIEKLRIWCQKVLPLVYDDSLSYYEVLTKVVNKLNEVIALAQEQNETIEEALSDIEAFETDMSAQFEAYKTTLNAALDAFEAEITAQQSGFEGRMTQEFADFLADYEREFGITNLYGDSTTLAISQNQVSKLLDYTTNNNRFNPEVVTSGKAIDNTGAVVNNSNTAVTGFIEVQPGENIVAQAKNNTTNERYQGAGTGTDVPLVFDSIAGYDEELTFVSGSYKSLVFNYQVPVGVKYIKLAMGQVILDGTSTDMSELAIVNSDGTIYPYQPYSEQNATIKMNALPVDDTSVGNHLWSANKINEFQAAVQGEFNQLETDLAATLQGAIGDMNANFTQKSAELDTEFDTLEGSIHAEQEAFETEIEGALASQKTELETKIGEVASDVQALYGSVATHGQAITNLAGIVTSIDGRVDTLETDMAVAKSDISDLEASDTQQSTDITGLKARMTTAEGEIDSLETASEEHTTAISNLQTKDAELVEDINGLSTRVGAAEGDIDLLERRADTLETDVDNLESDVVELEEKKADRVGYEKDLNVGAADMLIGNETISDNKAYNFRRTTDGNQNVGNRETDEIIGGTVVVNQLLINGDFENDSGWNSVGGTLSVNNKIATFTKTSENPSYFGKPVNIIPNHVYMLIGTIKSGYTYIALTNSSTNTNYVKTDETVISDSAFKTVGTLYKTTERITNTLFTIRNATAGGTDREVQAQKAMLIDLTQWFSSSDIADYVYNLEQTTAGTGIAWMFEYFPFLNGGYIPNNTGTLQSIVLSKRKLSEFNQWDEEWEAGAFNTTTGVNIKGSTQIRSNNLIPVVPNTQYIITVKSGKSNIIWVLPYGIDKKPLEAQYMTDVDTRRNGNSSGILHDTVFTIPSNCYYIKFYTITSYGLTYNNDICINFSGERNGEYEPYITHEYTLDSSKELRGVSKIDSNGKLYFVGDRYKNNVTRIMNRVALDSLTWEKRTTVGDNYRFVAALPTAKGTGSASVLGNFVCSKYITISPNDTYTAAAVGLSGEVTGGYVCVYDPSFEDAATFKVSLAGHNLDYEIIMPTTEDASPVPNPQICSPYGTEEYIDPRAEAGTIPFAIPTGHETVYNTSLNYKLNQIPELPTAAGVYKLQVTVSSGVPSYSWVVEA